VQEEHAAACAVPLVPGLHNALVACAGADAGDGAGIRDTTEGARLRAVLRQGLAGAAVTDARARLRQQHVQGHQGMEEEVLRAQDRGGAPRQDVRQGGQEGHREHAAGSRMEEARWEERLVQHSPVCVCASILYVMVTATCIYITSIFVGKICFLFLWKYFFCFFGHGKDHSVSMMWSIHMVLHTHSLCQETE
jgi:hypothetical protein